MTILSLRPSEIRYSQDSIAYYFGYGRYSGTPIGQTLDDLLQCKCYVRDIPTITVRSRDGLWYSGDNRRLWVFRKCEELGIVDRVPAIEGYISSSKFTTNDRGVSIRVRGNPGGRVWTQRYRKDLLIKEPSNHVVSPASVISTSCNDSVVQSLVGDEIHPPNPDLSVSSEDLTDIASVSDHSEELEPSQSKDCAEETGPYLHSSPYNVRNGATKGEDNPMFDADELDSDHRRMSGIKDMVSVEEITYRSTLDGLVHSDNRYVSVDISSLERGPNSSDHPASVDVRNSELLVVDTNQSTISRLMHSVDVELGPKVSESCQTSMSKHIETFLSKYSLKCVILLVIALVFLVKCRI